MTTYKLAVHPAEFWAGSETIAKINKNKLCLAASKGDCFGKIIAGHTIPRSQLQEIASDGHIYSISANPADLLANNGRFTVGEKGIGQFSVLNFFCAKHDQELFSRVENDDLIFDNEQLFLLHYRAMAAELYKKMNGLESARFYVKRAYERNNKKKLEFAKAFHEGTSLGLRDMVRTFSLCETLHSANDFDQINGLVVCFNNMPSIMTVGGFSPEFDYNGAPLQLLGKAHLTYEQIGLSILASKRKAAVIFTWLTGATVCRNFADSFIAQSPDHFSTLAIQTAFEHLENTCMNIEWWDSLRDVERKSLTERMQKAGSPIEGRTRKCLQYCGITFDDWSFDRHFFVGH